MGAVSPPRGSGVKADAAICRGFVGFTARFGSLSLLVSSLNDLGITSTTLISANERIGQNRQQSNVCFIKDVIRFSRRLLITLLRPCFLNSPLNPGLVFSVDVGRMEIFVVERRVGCRLVRLVSLAS